MKYLGFNYGKIIEGFALLPSISINWMKTSLKEKRCYNVQFAWLFWFFTIGTIHKKLKEYGY